MAKVFEYREVVGISPASIEEAIKQAVGALSENYVVAWFEVLSTRGRKLEGDELEYQVTVKAGCKPK